jgi:predicted amidohydrolase YtcJ
MTSLWKHIALLCLAFTVLPALNAGACENTGDALVIQEIREQREMFNQAIEQGDRNTIESLLRQDVILVTGTDSEIYLGREAQSDLWQTDFENPDRAVYVRTSTCIRVSPILPIALEYGDWRGVRPSADVFAAGHYSAKWRKVDGVWLVESEIFATEECGGDFCPTQMANVTAEGQADTVFTGGAVYTVNEAMPWAEAVAIRNGEIVFVGDTDDAQSWIGPQTEVLDLHGRMLLPGFQDSHLHITWGADVISTCTLDEANNPQKLRERLIACSKEPGRGTDNWLVGGIFERDTFPGGVPPRGFLDELFPDRPVSIETSDGHSRWANKKALELAGIDKNTINPKDGVIERDPVTGEPTGMLDAAAMNQLERVVPTLSAAEKLKWTREAVSLANSFGITSAIDPGLDYEQAEPLRVINEKGELNLRVLLGLSPTGFSVTGFGPEIYEFLAKRNTLTGGRLSSDSVKVFIDGVIENVTSPLLEPYEKGNSRPIDLFYEQQELNQLFTRLDQEGLSIHVHAIGDKGVRSTLDAFQVARTANGKNDNRHVMTHLQLVSEQDRGRFAELNIAASFSPLWAYVGAYEQEVYPPLIGQERILQTYPIGSLQRQGARIAGSSDWTVSSMNPLLAIEVGITRQDPFDSAADVLNESERVDLETMIRAYTINVAWLMKNENKTGSIEVGKRADLVVLDHNLFEISPYEISDTRVEMTLLDGEIVFRN